MASTQAAHTSIPRRIDTLNLALGLIPARRQKFTSLASQLGNGIDEQRMIAQVDFLESMMVHWRELRFRPQEELACLPQQLLEHTIAEELQAMRNATQVDPAAIPYDHAVRVKCNSWAPLMLAVHIERTAGGFHRLNVRLGLWHFVWSTADDRNNECLRFISQGYLPSGWEFGQPIMPLRSGHPDWYVIVRAGGVEVEGSDPWRLLPAATHIPEDLIFLQLCMTPLMLLLARAKAQEVMMRSHAEILETLPAAFEARKRELVAHPDLKSEAGRIVQEIVSMARREAMPQSISASESRINRGKKRGAAELTPATALASLFVSTLRAEDHDGQEKSQESAGNKRARLQQQEAERAFVAQQQPDSDAADTQISTQEIQNLGDKPLKLEQVRVREMEQDMADQSAPLNELKEQICELKQQRGELERQIGELQAQVDQRESRQAIAQEQSEKAREIV